MKNAPCLELVGVASELPNSRLNSTEHNFSNTSRSKQTSSGVSLRLFMACSTHPIWSRIVVFFTEECSNVLSGASNEAKRDLAYSRFEPDSELNSLSAVSFIKESNTSNRSSSSYYSYNDRDSPWQEIFFPTTGKHSTLAVSHISKFANIDRNHGDFTREDTSKGSLCCYACKLCV